jgi:predicted HTH transcriptional regulator
MPGLSLSDIDLEIAKKRFKGARELNEAQLTDLRLLVPYNGRPVPTTGAMLLFGKQREAHFPDAWIQCVRIRDSSCLFDHAEIHEDLPGCVGSVMFFLKKHVFRGAESTDIKRSNDWNIPLTILREALTNAIVHADYSLKSGPIRVSVFDDRIEIENPGSLLPGMTIEEVKQGNSKVRNQVITRAFRELNLMEQWGCGFPRIFKEAEDMGLPAPRIAEVGMKVRFTVYLRVAEESDQLDEEWSPARSLNQKENLKPGGREFLNKDEDGDDK